MITVPRVRKLAKSELDAIQYTGLITRVAEKTHRTHSTVSRTLRGYFKRPNPAVVRAIEEELDKLESPQ